MLRSCRFTKGTESTSRKLRPMDLPERCRNATTPSPRRSAGDFAPDYAPEHHSLNLPLRVRSHKVPCPTDHGWRLALKRSASLSDLPALNVSDEDEDEPLEKKVKLVSTVHSVDTPEPVSVHRAARPLEGSPVTYCSRLVYSLIEVSNLFLTLHLTPSFPSYPVPCSQPAIGYIHLPRIPAAIPLQLSQVLMDNLLQEASECGGCGLGQGRKCSICCETNVVSNLHSLFSLLFRTVLILRALWHCVCIGCSCNFLFEGHCAAAAVLDLL